MKVWSLLHHRKRNNTLCDQMDYASTCRSVAQVRGDPWVERLVQYPIGETTGWRPASRPLTVRDVSVRGS